MVNGIEIGESRRKAIKPSTASEDSCDGGIGSEKTVKEGIM